MDDKTLDIGRRLELFVDDCLVKEIKGLSLRLHSPTPEETVIQFDRPWEGPYSAYVTVMKNGDHFRMYYRGSGEGGWEVTCYAESRDGIEWTKPNLDLYSWDVGNELSINYATSACGLILVEVQDIEGTPIPGYALKECHQIYGDEVERIVSWRGGSNLGGFQSKGIRLRFLMRDADLYSLCFKP